MGGTAEQVEAQIREQVVAGQIDAATTLAINTYGPELHGYLLAVTHDQHSADEAFALACEAIWKALPGFRWESSLRTWAYAIVRRVLAQYRQRPAAQRLEQRIPSSMLHSIAEVRRSSTAPYQRTDLKDRFQELRATLDPIDHELLLLRLDRQMSWKDIARATADDDAGNIDQRAASLRKRFERLKDELRDLAATHGLLPET